MLAIMRPRARDRLACVELRVRTAYVKASELLLAGSRRLGLARGVTNRLRVSRAAPPGPLSTLSSARVHGSRYSVSESGRSSTSFYTVLIVTCSLVYALFTK